MAFYYQDGTLFCDGLSIQDIKKKVDHSPFYLYSANQIKNNYLEYKTALAGIPSIISYAVKANGNLTILKILQKAGSWVTLVSGNELQFASRAGFRPDKMIFNGNGKTINELRLAAEKGVLINIDSDFDLQHIHQVSQEVGKQIPVFLRINPGIDPSVHPYISTGQRQSKFGISLNQVVDNLKQIAKMGSLILVGIHCHLGSTIDEVTIFRRTMEVMADQYHQIQDAGFPIQYINLGGGLGLDYQHQGGLFPTPADLVEAIRGLIPHNATLILEPGRSIVGNAGILVCEVIGVKTSDEGNYIVVDGSMTELIRPSLYQAYHKIEYIEPMLGKPGVFDIVGPVCESADFLGLNRTLAIPPEGAGIAVHDAGAYGYAMSSNYNARNRPPEYLVDGDQLVEIRRAETFDDQLHSFTFTEDIYGETKNHN